MKNLNKVMSIAIAAAGITFAAVAQEAGTGERVPQESRTAGKDREAASERFCIQQTGSRIIANRNATSRSGRADCVASGGRVYTREDIERSGSTDLGDALRRLDPSLR